MMNKYLVLFQVGPVQDFIRMARRTDDYWAGSFLLSYSTAYIMKELRALDSQIIFPSSDNTLVRGVAGDQKLSGSALQPSLPNRVAALMDANGVDDIKKKADDIRVSVLGKITSWFEEIERELTGNSLVARKQVEDLIEFYCAFVEYDANEHGKSLMKAEEALAARKNVRNFHPSIEYGYKCTQCGTREPLRNNYSSKPDNSDIKSLRAYWQLLPRGEYTYAFKENERLCSICAGKRLFRRVCLDRESIPATSNIAVARWLDDNREELEARDVSAFVEALKDAHISYKGKQVPKNDAEKRPIFEIDGDCFILDSYDRFEVDSPLSDHEGIIKAKKCLKYLLKNLQAPPKYYAILALDGDLMGQKIRSLNSFEKHQEVTERFSQYTREVYRIVEVERHGYIIYYGGDEGIVLIPLVEMLETMEKLREKFVEITHSFTTLSIGVAVVHHQAPLGQALKAAQDALHQAKRVKGKNAFSISILKRSGSHMTCSAPWEVGGKKVMEHLKDWQQCYSEGLLSNRWYHHFAAIEPSIKDASKPALLVNELFHILPRHMQGNKDRALSLAAGVREMVFARKELAKFDNLLCTLYVPLYISQGGEV